MGYHRPGHKDLHLQIKEALQAKERFGESKYEAKKNGTMKDGIYSYATARIYHRECQRFAEYVVAHNPKGRHISLEAARSYAKQYILEENANPAKSAYTVKLERSALAKLYGMEARELGYVNERSRAKIMRSRKRIIISEKSGKEIRNRSTRAGHFSEARHADEVAFASGTGMRRSEMAQIRGVQLQQREDGSYYFAMEGWQCKGGRAREIPIIGDVARIKELCLRAGNGKVWQKIPAAMDVHHYRSCYASALYKALAREKDKIPKEDRYCCRGELRGIWYDKAAMMAVSQALGHNRINVIAAHYLR